MRNLPEKLKVNNAIVVNCFVYISKEKKYENQNRVKKEIKFGKHTVVSLTYESKR